MARELHLCAGLLAIAMALGSFAGFRMSLGKKPIASGLATVLASVGFAVAFLRMFWMEAGNG